MTATIRAVGRSENPGVPVLFGGHNLPPLVEIGVTALPKSWGATTPPASPGTTLQYYEELSVKLLCGNLGSKCTFSSVYCNVF